MAYNLTTRFGERFQVLCLYLTKIIEKHVNNIHIKCKEDPRSY